MKTPHTAAVQFTPGPWKAEPLGEFGICNVTSDGRPVAFTGTKYGRDEDEANARLIASAPAMYEKLDYLMRFPRAMENPGFIQEVSDLLASITKATAQAGGE